MKKDKMTICECCEYLDTMIGDNKEIKECIDYIQDRAKSMNDKLIYYKDKYENKDKKTKFRVWHNCQIGRVKNFYVDVKSVEEAWIILNTLWNYDWFQYTNRIKGDYANASGFEYLDEEENEWCEWYDEDGLEIREHFESLE